LNRVPSRSLSIVRAGATGSSRGRRLVVALAVTALGASGCGAAGSEVTAKPGPPRVTVPEPPCMPIVCDPNRDYGQPTLASLQDAQAHMPARTVAVSPSAQTTTEPPSTVPVVAQAGQQGPAGAAGPAGITSPDFAAVYSKAQASVARIDYVNCFTGEGKIASGFVVGPRLLATAGHVVKNRGEFEVTVGHQVVGARAIGLNDSDDVGLLQLDRPVAAPVLHLASAWPAVGSPVAVIGWARADLGLPASMQTGIVSAINVDYNGGSGYLETDTGEDHGSSGGPVFDPSGRVVGIVSAGLSTWDAPGGGVVSLQAGSIGAAKLIAGWSAKPRTVPGTC